jgi:TRAP-type C4-dicarboxylate transport system substrate-binding protein
LVAAAAIVFATSAGAQEAKHYRFAHDQQLNTGYSVAYDIFSARLKELSKGTMLIDQYPGAQLGQEPQLLQLVKAGDIEFAIVSSANTATISPQAGVMSLHFLFRNADHLIKSLADKQVISAITAMIDETTQGLHVIATGSQGVRNIYSKKEIHNVGDLKGIKIGFRQPPRRTRSSRLTARRPCTCRSAASTPRCRPASSTPPKTALTSTSSTDTMK